MRVQRSGSTARIERQTSESKVLVEVDLDGSGRHDISTGVGFYDHMLTAFARHALLDLTVQTEGDTHIDAHHTVEDTAIVLGDNRPFIAALLTVDEEALTTWRRQRGEGATGGGDRVNDLDLRTELQLAVDDVNATVSRPESIRAFAILPADLSIADGELTPTMKVRRAVVESHYATVIDELYATAPSPARSGP